MQNITVNAIIKRRQGPVFVMEAELLDKCGHSVVIVSPAKVTAAESQPEVKATLDQYIPDISRALDDFKKTKEDAKNKGPVAATTDPGQNHG